MAKITMSTPLFDKIRIEKQKFFAREENSNLYLQLIREFMKEKADFDLSLYRDNYLKGRIYTRIRAKKIESFRDYLAYLQNKPGEIHALQSLLTIHTTEFFRDKNPFRYIEKILLPKIMKQKFNVKKPIRILSAPCSTGEEVYSLAIIAHFLKTVRKVPNPIEIYGVDIDRKSVEAAAYGIYRRDFIKNISPQSMVLNFDIIDHNYIQVKDEIKQYCKFIIQDIFKPLPFNYKFDLILCRNFLIYISKQEQMRIIENLKRNAYKGTYFMLGITEGLNLMNREEFRTESLEDHIYQFIEKSGISKIRQRETPKKTNDADLAKSPNMVKKYPIPNQISRSMDKTEKVPSFLSDRKTSGLINENSDQRIEEHGSESIELVDSYNPVIPPEGKLIYVQDENLVYRQTEDVEFGSNSPENNLKSKEMGIKIENIKILRNSEFTEEYFLDPNEFPEKK